MKKVYILLILIGFVLPHSGNAQPLTGTKNIPGDYATIAAAVAALNANGVGSGGVTFNVAAGHTETITATIVLTATGTASDPIVFQKSGAGANPLITAYTGTSTPGSATQDGIWALVGSDYVTIDGIDLTDPNSANPATMEYGYGLFKASVTNGCQNVTIQNCTITLNRVNNASGSGPAVEGSKGIEVVNATRTAHTTALTPTSSSGSNSFNKFYSNTIQNCNYGIVINGFAATSGVGPSPDPATFLGDLNNDIGGTSSSTGNTILNYGGAPSATNPAAGIRVNNQWGVNISYNTINNNDGSGVNHVTTLRGIFAQAGTSANATINNNTVIVQSGAATSACTAIDNGIGSTAASNTININNNSIQIAYPTATTGVYTAINNSATAATVNINNNTITQIPAVALAGTGTHVMIETGSPTTANTNNNTIQNISRTGASGLWRGIKTTSPTNWTCNNNTIENLSWTAAASTGSIDAIYSLSSAVNVTCNNNIIRNLSTPTTGTINGIREWGTTGTKTFQNNQIYNFSTTSGGAGGATFNGIFCSTGNIEISSNSIYNLNSTGTTGGSGGTIYGIQISGGTTTNIFRNNIYNLSTLSTNPVVAGLLISAGTTTNAYNNFISDLRATAANAANPLIGISVTGGTTVRLYYNTVFLNGTSSGALFGSSAISASTTPTLDLRNNIFVNLSTPNGTGLTVAYRRSSTTLTSYASASNNNDFFAGTPSSNRLIFHDGTNSDQTISAYKTRVAPRDNLSFSENPPFVNVTTTPYNLHLQTSVATQCESGGQRITTPIAITNDFDDDLRWGETGYTGAGTAVDVGADEFEGTPLDLTPPTITYTLLSNSASLTTRTLTNFATITDASGVNTTTYKPRIYFKKSSDNNTYVGNTASDNGWKYAEASNASSPFSFTIDYSIIFGGSVAVGDVIQYFVVAQDESPAINVGINSGTFAATPANVDLTATAFPIGGTINSYTIVAGISGAVTVGTGGTYSTLTGAGGLFADINSKVVTGDITATIISDLTETGANALNQMAVEGGSWTLTIQPDAATVRNITGNPTGGLIRLNGADRVIIDGRYSGAGNYLTFSNTATSGTIATIQLISLGTGQGCENVTIRNCNISTGFNGATSYGIFAGASSIGTAGDDHDNLTITENNITKAHYGLRIMSNSTGKSDNVTITKNSIGSNTVADYIGKYGMEFIQINNSTIAENTVFNIKTNNTNLFGISIGTGVTNTTISRNLIYGLNYTGTAGYGGKGIDINTGVATSNLTVANNVIYDIGGDGWNALTTDANVGIRVLGTSGGINIYYNSVNLYGTWNRSATATLSAALYVPSGVTNIDVRNNVFSNSIVNASNTGAKAYAIYNAGTSGVFSQINYNDYFASGTQGVLGFLSSDITTLTAWQTATGQDANSLASDPLFNSNTNLVPQTGSPLLAAGTPISGITTDFTGATRSASNPSIGAYENTGDFTAPSITYTALSNTSSTSNRVLTNFATITDASGVNTTTYKPRLYFKKSTDNNTYVGNTASDNGWKYVEASNASSPFSFTINYAIINGGSVSTGDVIQYFVVAQDLATTPNVGINSGTFAATPANVDLTAAAFPIGGTINSYSIVGTISGNKTVGTGGDYPSLTGSGGLFEDINNKAVTGDITATIISDLTETGANALNEMAVEGGNWTLTIQPDAATVRNITGNFAGGLIRLNGADRVTIDGRYSGSGNYLSFTNSNNTSSAAVIWVFSPNATNPATDVTIRNCIVTGGGSSTLGGIIVSGSNMGGIAEADNSNVQILHNQVRKAQYGIAAVGTTTGQTNGVVSNNQVGSNTPADKISFVGMFISNQQNCTVENNAVKGVSSSASNNNPSGITVAGVSQNSILNANEIADIKNTNTSGWGASGIILGSTTNTTNLRVSNNVIYDIAGYGYSGNITDNGIGIRVTLGGGYNIDYNSVNLATNQTVAGQSAAMYIEGIGTGFNLRNNIFANQQTTGTRYAIYSAVANTAFGTINYNDYFSTQHVGFLTSAQSTLSAWQTATGQDANSISTNPLFTANDDLQPEAASPVIFAGTPVSGITNDFAGFERSTSNPSLGAYEYEKNSTGKFVVYGAADMASNYTSWTNGSNQGQGFGSWSIATGGGGYAGAFLGNPSSAGITGMSNPSFALFANPGGSGAFVNADRTLIVPLPVYGTLSFDYGTNWDTDISSGNKGFNLYVGGISGTQIININQSNSATITINGNPMFTAYGTNKITFNFERTSATQLRVYATGRDGLETYDQTFTFASSAVDAIRFYVSQMNDNNANREPYFNNFKIVTNPPSPSTVTADIRGQVVVESPTTFSNIIIPSSHSVVVKPNQFLTVNGIYNYAGNSALRIESNSTGTGSLLHKTNNVPATIQRYITGNTNVVNTMDYHLVAVPLNAGVTSGQFLGSYLYRFDVPTQAWTSLGTATNTPMSNDQGYMIFYPNTSTTYTFSGQLNNGSFTAATPMANADGFALVPNPYPSAMDWDATSGWTKSNLQNAIWIWNPASDQYASYIGGVGTNGGTRYIPVGQAYFVKSNAASPVLSTNNGVRVHNNSPFFKSGQNLPDLLRIHAQGNDRSDEIALRLLEGSSAQYDAFDADKLYGAEVAPQIYFVTPDGYELSINHLSKTEVPISIPVGFKLNAQGLVSLSFEGIDSFDPDLQMLFEDLLTGAVINLREAPTYSFSHQPNNNTQRFVLHLTSITSNPSPVEASAIRAWFDGRDICLSLPESTGTADIQLFDPTGRLLAQYERNATPLIRIPAPRSHAVMLRLRLNQQMYSTKVFTF